MSNAKSLSPCAAPAGEGVMQSYRAAVRGAELSRRRGVVLQVNGLAIEARGPQAAIGELCRLISRTPGPRGDPAAPAEADSELLAEVVAVTPDRTILLPYGSTTGLAAGCVVEAAGARADVGVGPGLLGRVIDAFGAPLDGRPPPRLEARVPLRAASLNPLTRPPVTRVLETGVRAIDGLLTLGQGQRIGIFSGSGVGKSSLLGMIARHVRADVNVIALIGERGREVRDFIDRHLGAAGLARSVVVVATSDQPAPQRLRATHAALAIAGWFRDAGRQVLFTLDSATRFAMARREVGLAAGEPPTARGYTPSVFGELPVLCERCGPVASGGAISALFTVLTDRDDLDDDPVADALRGCLDGHIVLARDLAQRAHYPAIDVLRSTSRLVPVLLDETERGHAQTVQRLLAELERNRTLVDLGAYQGGSNALLDAALAAEPGMLEFLQQREGGAARADTLARLANLASQAALAAPGASARPVMAGLPPAAAPAPPGAPQGAIPARRFS